MKKIILVLVAALSLNLCSCSYSGVVENVDTDSKVQAGATETEAETKRELRGVWLSFYEISEMCKGVSEATYRINAEEVIRNISDSKLNTVFYQVRCFSDALYKSSVFPTSKYIVETEGDSIDFDPLKIFIEIAGQYNVDVHAWVNPLRISYENNISSLNKSNPARILYNEDEDLSSLIICEKGMFYNPADEEARKVILSGVRELLENYDIKGVQFDDYFYPECDDINDGILYNEYKANNGQLSLEEWRKSNVSSLVSSVYNLVKGYDVNCVFGVSPSANFEKNEKIYADIKLWCKEEGFVDYIMPQVYFGFINETMPFETVVEEWCKIERCKGVELYCGFSPYKCGASDENAGEGKNEWIESDDIISRQYEYLKQTKFFEGFALYSYSYCFGENVTENSKIEIDRLINKL
ncbi:MAG: family 10 glycosylhydrolase [Clostridia bacterium]|nr:family 10 glycosylhydrolase [Clostridia bacterium]